jgi:hypothetical protein
MHFKTTLLLVICVLLIGLGCTGQSAAQVQAKKLTAADLQKLRWIEGTWRGTGDADKHFFERYRFENATTLAVDSFDNEKLEKVTDTTLFELKDGEFGGGSEGSHWAASALDDKSVTFLPITKARNTFRWESVGKDEWKAVLNWPATADKPARERVYKMERWPQKQ